MKLSILPSGAATDADPRRVAENRRIDNAGTAQAASTLDVQPSASSGYLVSVSHGQTVQQSAPDHSSSILARTVESPTQHW
jgi:hypothetical protein